MSKDDRKSYIKYKEMILNSPAVKQAHIIDDKMDFTWNREKNSGEKQKGDLRT